MGIVSFVKPGSDAITLGGYWEYIGETGTSSTVYPQGGPSSEKRQVVLAPNARSWAVRSAFGGVMNILGMSYGTKECYVIIAACAGFRETVDSIQCVMEGGDMLKKAFIGYWIPKGKFHIPPIYFPPWAGGAIVNFIILGLVVHG